MRAAIVRNHFSFFVFFYSSDQHTASMFSFDECVQALAKSFLLLSCWLYS